MWGPVVACLQSSCLDSVEGGGRAWCHVSELCALLSAPSNKGLSLNVKLCDPAPAHPTMHSLILRVPMSSGEAQTPTSVTVPPILLSF